MDAIFQIGNCIILHFLLDKYHSCKVLLKKAKTISLMFCLLKWKYVFEDKLPVLNGQTIINCLFLNEQDVFFNQNEPLIGNNVLNFKQFFIPRHSLSTMVILNTGVTI